MIFLVNGFLSEERDICLRMCCFFCALFLQTSIAALSENSPPFEIGLKGEVKTSDSSDPSFIT